MKRIAILGLLLLSLFALNVTLPAATTTAEAYECKPAGTWYCWNSTQCAGFCGTGVPADWAVCEQGCCRCAG
ncbi:MAG TPA: hypothetical protein VLE27_15725 [Thermoanaerobaculia bacterium]|nr:hypothetical protein [Thermoanaerobaculia bacterium]